MADLNYIDISKVSVAVILRALKAKAEAGDKEAEVVVDILKFSAKQGNAEIDKYLQSSSEEE